MGKDSQNDLSRLNGNTRVSNTRVTHIILF